MVCSPGRAQWASGDRLEARRQRLLERQLPELDEGEPQFYEARAP